MKSLLRHPKAPLYLALVILPLLQIIQAAAKGTLGDIGADNDDMMRLLQIRDLLNGQGWFDLHQYRMGLEEGTLMHWSRIADLPIVILTHFFDIFMPRDTALVWAYSIWPPLTLCFAGIGIWIGARALGGQKSALFAMIIFALTYEGFYRFMPGSIDHHNLQIGLLALTMGLALDPQQRVKHFAWAGLTLGLSLTVGVEVYFFVAVFCAFFAINWLVKGDASSQATGAFGLSFAASVLALFFITVPPARFLSIHCDAFSFITLIAALGGGLGLALATRLTTGRSITYRIVALAALGAYALSLLVVGGPQCLANPLDSLPQEMRDLWLGNVTETQPAFSKELGQFTSLPFYLGTVLTASIVTIWQIRKRQAVTQNLLLLALLLLGTVLMFYQVRFAIFATLFAIVPLAAWVARIWASGKITAKHNIKYLLALFVCVPGTWALPGILLVPEDLKMEEMEAEKNAQAECFDEKVQTALNGLETGRFAQLVNSGTRILHLTDHKILSGNYHRNIDGQMAGYDIFGAAAEDAQALLLQYGVNYIYVCRPQGETTLLVNAMPDGLIAALVNRETPNYLEELDPDLADGQASIYIFRPAD